MTVGALCDLGVKPSTLEWELSKLEIGDFHMHFERKHRHNIEGVAFSIHGGATHTHEPEEHAHEDHDHEGHEAHVHGEHCGHEHHHHDEEEHSHEHSPATQTGEELPPHDHEHGDEVGAHHHHPHDPEHGHAHKHEGGHEHHHHVHGRSHHEIRELIQGSELSEFVKTHALAIFQRIAVAEGKIHGMAPARVEFHEVGALDSIADIVCVCAGLEALGVEKVYASALHDGTGWIECAHGRFPLPAPATLEILTGIPISQTDEPHELITPTGAAILAEFGAGFGLMPQLTVEKIGYGIGQRHLDSRPNVLRAVLGELTPSA